MKKKYYEQWKKDAKTTWWWFVLGFGCVFASKVFNDISWQLTGNFIIGLGVIYIIYLAITTQICSCFEELKEVLKCPKKT